VAVPIDDRGMQDALDRYNSQLAKSRSRIRLFKGLAMCAGAALSWGLAVLGAVSVLTDPKVGAVSIPEHTPETSRGSVLGPRSAR
jgi:hypothetical protein